MPRQITEKEKTMCRLRLKEKFCRTPAELQALKLEQLLQDPDKPVVIPDKPVPQAPPEPPEFVRNVVGSSAGAGSAEFHIYRNNRKKETLRLEWLDKEAKRKELDSEYERRRAEREREIEERTNKKRSKRQKQKEKMKKRRLEEKAQKASRRSESQSQNDSSDTTSDEDSCDEGDKPAVSGSRITPTTSDDQTAVPPSLTAT